MEELAPWLALAFRSALPSADQQRIARGAGPRAEDYPAPVLAREKEDLHALADLGVRVLTLADPDYPDRLRAQEGPVVLQVAGRAELLAEEGVEVLAGWKELAGILDRGDRAVVVLSKGLLRAKSLLRALHEPLADGQVALVSAEPPRAAWGPVRDRRGDHLRSLLRGA